MAVVFLIAHRLRHVPLVNQIRKQSKHRQWAIDLRLAVIVLVWLAFVAQKVGASLLMAGFGTGLVVAAIGGPRRLSQEVLGLGQSFLLPLFFVLLGGKADLRALGDDHRAVILACLLTAFTIVVHVLASTVIRAPKAVGLLASAQMGVPAAVIALGARTRDQPGSGFGDLLRRARIDRSLQRRSRDPGAEERDQPSAAARGEAARLDASSAATDERVMSRQTASLPAGPGWDLPAGLPIAWIASSTSLMPPAVLMSRRSRIVSVSANSFAARASEVADCTV